MPAVDAQALRGWRWAGATPWGGEIGVVEGAVLWYTIGHG